MRWHKLGRIITINNLSGWQASHAYLPTAIQLAARIRVFLAFRDSAGVGRMGWVDVRSDDPSQCLAISSEPCLDIGEAGAFDDNGVSPLSVLRHEGRLWMYYAGWQLTPRARYLLLTGLAYSEDDGQSFIRHSSVPVMERSAAEMLIRSGTFVMKDDHVWRAWYASGRSLIDKDGIVVPTYNLSYMESSDGITWPSQGKVCLEPLQPDEFGFGRPWVLKRQTLFEMFYSVRTLSQVYRIGYGTSQDGIVWRRQDDRVGIDCAQEGWDSEMIGFASIIENEFGTFLFYNGNDYGKTGFGVAKLEQA